MTCWGVLSRAASLFAAGIVGTLAAASAAVPEFTTPATDFFLATEGKAALVWRAEGAPDSARFELQQSRTNTFPARATRTRYRGPDRGTFISGLAAGDYFFRVRVADGDDDGESGGWSRPVQVRVEYVPLGLVFGLTGIGGVVFLSTVWVVLAGHRRFGSARSISDPDPDPDDEGGES